MCAGRGGPSRSGSCGGGCQRRDLASCSSASRSSFSAAWRFNISSSFASPPTLACSSAATLGERPCLYAADPLPAGLLPSCCSRFFAALRREAAARRASVAQRIAAMAVAAWRRFWRRTRAGRARAIAAMALAAHAVLQSCRSSISLAVSFPQPEDGSRQRSAARQARGCGSMASMSP